MENNKWKISDVPDLSRKVMIVTGGNGGLGYESVKVFAENNAEVVLACRNITKGEAAKKEILNSYPNAKIDVMNLDVANFSSVRNFAEEFKNKYNRIDVLMNNAGIMMTPYSLTVDGFESQMATNHLGHFLLTGLLIDLIINTPKSRVVNISSIAHKKAKLPLDDIFYLDKKNYSPMKAYRTSKLANLLFTQQLQRAFYSIDTESIAVSAHPGVTHTNLANHLVSKSVLKVVFPIAKLFTQKPKNGALPQIRAAVDPNVKAGEYYGPSGFLEWAGKPVLVNPTKNAMSREYAQILWVESEKATNFKWSL